MPNDAPRARPVSFPDPLAALEGADALLAWTLVAVSERLYGPDAFAALFVIDEGARTQRRHLVRRGGFVRLARDDAFEDGSLPEPIDHAIFPTDVADRAPVVRRVDQVPAWKRPIVEHERCCGIVAFPLVAAGRPVGSLIVGIPDGQAAPSSETLTAAAELARRATPVLQLLRLGIVEHELAPEPEHEHAARRRLDALTRANATLQQSLDTMTAASDVDGTLRGVLEVAARHVRADEAMLFVRVDGRWIVRASVEATVATARSCADMTTLVQRADVWSALDRAERAIVVGTTLLVPLWRTHVVIGCLAVATRSADTVSLDDLGALQTLAHQAALALELERLALAAETESRDAAALAERTRIARDLHDTLAQGLTAIVMHLQASLREADSAQARHHVREALEQARGALVDARRSVHALRTDTQRSIDFATALRGVLRTTFAGSGVAAEVTGQTGWAGMERAVEDELLRIAQEAATNTLKHARARRFDAVIDRRDGVVVLSLRDDGVGFDPAAADEGFGLVGMSERATRIDARLAIVRDPRGGTRIDVTVSDAPTTVAPSRY